MGPTLLEVRKSDQIGNGLIVMLEYVPSERQKVRTTGWQWEGAPNSFD